MRWNFEKSILAWRRKSSLVWAGLLVPLLIGCSPTAKKSTVSIQMPGQVPAPVASSAKGEISAAAVGATNWSLQVPATLGEVGCYAVFVGGPEPELNANSCRDANGNTLMRFGRMAGFYSAGAMAQLEVPAGSDRQFFILGVKLVNGVCELRMPVSTEFTFSNYSYPYLIGHAVKSLVPGDNALNITLKESFTEANKVADCTFMPATTDPALNPTPAPNPAPTPTPVPQASKLALGNGHTCALFSHGRVKCWGNGSMGALGTGAIDNRGDGPGELGEALPYIDLGAGKAAVEIAGGNQFSCARLS
ncbi:MAG: RCC1 domain-containing protein, partial [Bdellovibrionaceae bacterium]|nr:RCC1 domain-containing protein [Pseudobdellovibrionaceae bacterium]